MKKVCIIGTGYVGLVSGACLAEIGNRVMCVDRDKTKIDTLNAGGLPIYEPGLLPIIKKNAKAKRLYFTTDIAQAVRSSEIIFIAVNTPPLKDGGADLSFVEACTREVARHANGYKLLVEKSTVPVQTGDRVRRTVSLAKGGRGKIEVASNPEFLKEGTAVKDFLKPDRLVFGVETPRGEKLLRDLYKRIKTKIVVTDINSAELIKHASNSFLALKISYINAVAQICDHVGADVSQVAYGMGLDTRIGSAFLRAGIGYGGSCFPKDVAAFVKIAERNGYDFDLLKAAQAINNEQRSLVWKRLEEELWTVRDKTIAILGLAFKPETDDLRNAPSIDVIEYLLNEGARIRAYDPVAADKMKDHFPDITYAKTPYDAAKGADAALLLTEWPQISKMDLKKLKRNLRTPVLIDGRNVFDPDAMARLGFRYRSVGRPARFPSGSSLPRLRTGRRVRG